MMRLIGSLVLVLVVIPAFAETLQWEPPTTREDGTPLDPVTELKEYRLQCGSQTYVIPATTADPEGYEVSKSKILTGYGEHECYMVAVDTEGLTSKPSNSVTIEWQKRPPAVPTNLVIITD